MTNEQKFRELEEQCQQRYALIDSCYRSIENAQKELSVLEVKYLKTQAKLKGATLKKRTSKLDKIRQSLLRLGVDEKDIDSFIKA